MSKIKVTQRISKLAGRPGLWVKKHSPEIMLVVGVAGVVTSTVMASKATLKLGDILDEAKETTDLINKAVETHPEKYSEDDRKKDMVIHSVQTTVQVVKLYTPAAIVGTLSIGLIVGSHRIMKKRNVALVGAYKVLEEGFNKYRERVVEDLGEDADQKYRYGMVEEKVKEKYTDKEGKERTKTVKKFKVDDYDSSVYAKFFDELNANWQNNPEYNMVFLKQQQNFANDMLRARGHLFLNEVYDMLGLPHTQAGSVVGWVVSKEGDNYVDFNLFDRASGATREFVNGYEAAILLDFNVDGIIYDKI